MRINDLSDVHLILFENSSTSHSEKCVIFAEA